VAEEGDEELAARVASKEISASGPLFGHKLLLGSGEPLAEEQAILEREGIELKELKGVRPVPDLSGARRPMRVPVSELQFDLVEGGAQLQFFLPAGAYATSLVEELRKDLWMTPAPDHRPKKPMVE
jgi:tRNA pseudouridine13 synthase